MDQSDQAGEPVDRAADLDRRIQWLRARADKLARGEHATEQDAVIAAEMLQTAYNRSREAHRQAARACERAAEAHERAALVLDRLADAGVGDADERRRAAARHRSLADDDRERAAAEWALADVEPEFEQGGAAGSEEARRDTSRPESGHRPGN